MILPRSHWSKGWEVDEDVLSRIQTPANVWYIDSHVTSSNVLNLGSQNTQSDDSYDSNKALETPKGNGKVKPDLVSSRIARRVQTSGGISQHEMIPASALDKRT